MRALTTSFTEYFPGVPAFVGIGNHGGMILTMVTTNDEYADYDDWENDNEDYDEEYDDCDDGEEDDDKT